MSSNSIINIYDGVRVEGDPNVKRSNVLIYYGRVNMYGGEVVNGYGANGGNFLVGYNNGYYLNYLCVYGGKITGGNATGMGGNIYSVYDSFVYIYDGQVTGGQAAKGGNLAINGGANMRIYGGTVTGGNATSLGDGVYATNIKTKYTSKTEIDETTGEKLVQNLYLKDCGVVIGPKATFEGETYTENNAYVRVEKAYTEPQLKDNLEHLYLSGDLTLDLNGYSVSHVTTYGHKLTVFDSATDDYDVADGKYGTVPSSAEVVAAPGYMELTKDGKTSFHKYEMELTDLVVNTGKKGISYKTTFKGDQAVKGQIKEYGIAMRAYAEPNATTIWTDPGCLTHVAMPQSDWQIGDGDNTIKSVYITNILVEGEQDTVNQARANVPIYGRAYIQLLDGTMIFSESVKFTMQEATEYMDTFWDKPDLTPGNKTALVNFYNTYKGCMQNWNIPNIQAAAAEAPA